MRVNVLVAVWGGGQGSCCSSYGGFCCCVTSGTAVPISDRGRDVVCSEEEHPGPHTGGQGHPQLIPGATIIVGRAREQ